MSEPRSGQPQTSTADLAAAVIDSLEFARGGRRLEGVLRLAGLSRLRDLLVVPEGELSVSLEGWRDGDGKSWLRLAVSGEPVLQCQRCLGGVRFPLVIDSVLQLVGLEEEWPDEDLADDSADAIEADKALSVAPLVEEEVLLALPIAPRHEQCEPPLAADDDHGLSPFAALAALKKH